MKKYFFYSTLCLFLSFSLLSASPQTVSELWKNYDARAEPLNTEIIKSWEKDKGAFKLVRYLVGNLKGSNKSAAPKMAAFYGSPKNGKNLPAIVHIHGGGQRASLSRVEYWVSLGYAAISINWGGYDIDQPNTPNTDWDGLAAGFLGDKTTKHHNEIAPSLNTLYKEPHPMNSSWMLIAMAARRGLTFLENQPQVDKDHLGVEGHSMGGRSTSYVAIDSRIKAASPSVGGSGYLYENIWGLPGSARRMTENVTQYKNTISSQNYWRLVTCPTLFLGATNDFNSPTEFVSRALNQIPQTTNWGLALAPHLNHRFTSTTAAARTFWMESHLKENFHFPKTSKATMVLTTDNKIPLFKVWPDRSTQHKVEKVDIYYGYARDPRIRFWRDAKAKKVDDHYEAACPIFDTNEPLFAFANITYDTGKTILMPRGSEDTSRLTLSSDYITIYPETLKENKIKATEKTERKIDDFSRGWHDWYRLNFNNTQHWFASTRKIVDPTWMGPHNGKLAFEVTTSAKDNRLLITLEQNTWQGYTGRTKDTYTAVAALPKQGKNSITLTLSDFKNSEGKTLSTWNESTELSFSQTANHKRTNIPKQKWNGDSPTFQNLRWVDGHYQKTLHPHQSRSIETTQKKQSFDDEFQKSIQDSVKLEQLDHKIK